MSISPSLHIWSSIKIPFSVYDRRQNPKGKVKSSVSYLDPFNSIAQMQNPERIVNLRVPDPLRKGNDNPIPIILSTCPTLRRKKTSRKSTTHVTVPDVLELNSREGDSDRPCCKDEFDKIFDEKSDDFIGRLEFDDRKEFHCVPFVKPWTAKELEEVNNRYILLEEEREKRRKRKQNPKPDMKVTEPPNQSPEPVQQTSYHDLIPDRKRLKPNASVQDSFAQIQSENLIKAELYLIKLGMNTNQAA